MFEGFDLKVNILLIIIIISLTIQAQENNSSVIFSPFVSLNTQYNSNFFKTADTNNEASSLMFQLLPGFKLNNKNNTNTDIKFDFNASYDYFMSVNDVYPKYVENNNGFSLNSNLGFVAFKQGNFSFFISDSFKKLSFSGYSKPISKLSNKFNVGFFTTPLGKSLKFNFKYSFGLNKTLGTDELLELTRVATEAQDNMSHDFSIGSEWKFLPKTSFIVEAIYGMVIHSNISETNKALLGSYDSTPILGRVGLLGVITPKLAAKIYLGWAYSDYENGTDFNSFVANIEFTYGFTPKSRIVFGYEREFTDVVFSNYLEYHKPYLNFLIKKGYLDFGANSSLTLNMFSDISVGQNADDTVQASSSRSELLLIVNPFISYNYKDKYKAEFRYTITKNFTDFTTEYVSNSDLITVKYNYLQQLVALNFYIFF